MSKAKDIYDDAKLTNKEKIKRLEEHYDVCGNWTDKNQTYENTDKLYAQLKEILGYIIKLNKEVKNENN